MSTDDANEKELFGAQILSGKINTVIFGVQQKTFICDMETTVNIATGYRP